MWVVLLLEVGKVVPLLKGNCSARVVKYHKDGLARMNPLYADWISNEVIHEFIRYGRRHMIGHMLGELHEAYKCF